MSDRKMTINAYRQTVIKGKTYNNGVEKEGEGEGEEDRRLEMKDRNGEMSDKERRETN